jgi:hypothetical protein
VVVEQFAARILNQLLNAPAFVERGIIHHHNLSGKKCQQTSFQPRLKHRSIARSSTVKGLSGFGDSAAIMFTVQNVGLT